MIEFNKIFMITAHDMNEDAIILENFKNPYWLGEVGFKKFPKSYFVDLNKENEKIVKKIINDKWGEIK